MALRPAPAPCDRPACDRPADWQERGGVSTLSMEEEALLASLARLDSRLGSKPAYAEKGPLARPGVSKARGKPTVGPTGQRRPQPQTLGLSTKTYYLAKYQLGYFKS